MRNWRKNSTMSKFKLLNMAAILSSTIATPLLAQAVIQEPGAYAFYHPNGGLKYWIHTVWAP